MSELRDPISYRIMLNSSDGKYGFIVLASQLCFCLEIYIFIFMGATALTGQGLLIIEASPSHSYTPHSVELLWTSL